MTAGVAAADVTVGGFGYVGVTDNAAGTNVNSAVRLTFTGTVETDGGVTFTGFARADVVGGGTAPTFNYNRVSVAYSGLTLTVGNTHTAMNTYARGMSAWGYTNGGVWFRTMQQSGMGLQADSTAGSRVLASYSFGDFVVGAGSMTDGVKVNGASMDFGGRYSANGLTFGAAMDDDSNWQAEASYAMDAITVRAAGNSDDSFMLGASYAVDSALTVALAYYDKAGVDDLGLNVTYNLGGGATLSATAGQAGAGEVIGLGVQFSF